MKPIVLEATARGMVVRLFDQLAVAPDGGGGKDPVVTRAIGNQMPTGSSCELASEELFG